MENTEKNFNWHAPRPQYPPGYAAQDCPTSEEKSDTSTISQPTSNSKPTNSSSNTEKSDTMEVHNVHYLPTSFRMGIWSILILLIVRELIPGVEDDLSAFYQFIDCIVLPLFNWCYAILLNIIQFIISLPVIRHIIAWLTSLA